MPYNHHAMSPTSARSALSSAEARGRPAEAERFPPIDERLVMPGSAAEILDGRMLMAPGADLPHASRHAQLAYLLQAHTAPGFIEQVIIQEGVPSVVTSEQASAEPVIYMIGCELAGGFLRTHAEKSSTESLNSPGAVYKKLCVTDLYDRRATCPKENVYGWSAKIGLLAIGLEAQDMKIEFNKYTKASCGSI